MPKPSKPQNRTTSRIDGDTYRSVAYGSRVRLLVFHSFNVDFCTGITILTTKLSAHYVIADDRFIPRPTARRSLARRPKAATAAPQETASIFQLVPESERAWHAGVGAWQTKADVNDRSIGIEVCGYFDEQQQASRSTSAISPKFTRSETEAMVFLASDILGRYPDITPLRVIGHSDAAPGRKYDPGKFFPWHELYRHGIGAWPQEHYLTKARARLARRRPDTMELQRQLNLLGYCLVENNGKMTANTRYALAAFQQHWHPQHVSGKPDVETLAILEALLHRYA